jgi:hypothetical protein
VEPLLLVIGELVFVTAVAAISYGIARVVSFFKAIAGKKQDDEQL